MIDLHCHFLPAIDDGPASLDESLRMARMAVINGITHSVMTPHIHPGRYHNDKQNIAQAVDSFRSDLAEHDIPLEISWAAEMRIGPQVLNMVAGGQMPYLGKLDGYDVLLLEFPHETIPIGSRNLVDWLIKQNVRPMIAHPERNKDVMRKLDKIRTFVDAGCLLQLTAASVANRFGDQARERAVDILENGWATVIATDAHNVSHRPPDLAAGRDAAAQIVGEEEANRLVYDTPARIIGK